MPLHEFLRSLAIVDAEITMTKNGVGMRVIHCEKLRFERLFHHHS